jgi:hypothetical protein
VCQIADERQPADEVVQRNLAADLMLRAKQLVAAIAREGVADVAPASDEPR